MYSRSLCEGSREPGGFGIGGARIDTPVGAASYAAIVVVLTIASTFAQTAMPSVSEQRGNIVAPWAVQFPVLGQGDAVNFFEATDKRTVIVVKRQADNLRSMS